LDNFELSTTEDDPFLVDADIADTWIPAPGTQGQTLNICPAGDKDWFTFTLKSKKALNSRVNTKTPESIAWTLTLAGKEGAIQSEITQTTQGLSFETEELEPGTYLLVFHGNPNSQSQTVPEYSLVISLVDACLPQCVGKACGPDGCGGTCGECSEQEVCSGNGQCGL